MYIFDLYFVSNVISYARLIFLKIMLCRYGKPNGVLIRRISVPIRGMKMPREY
jgi:hypothetical protein